jgi:hypothetical protein
MSFSIFWSWQSDIRANCNRTIIRKAIESAMAKVVKKIEIDPMIQDYNIYESAVGVSGTPSITDAIISRINNCNIFIADLTLVGKINKNKMTPNPNVLIEMGYAAAKIGWNSIITIMNTHFGKSNELPFDLQNRRFPISYRSSPDESNRSKIKEELTKEVEDAITSIISNQEQIVHSSIEKMDYNCLMLMNMHKNNPAFSTPISTDIIMNGSYNDIDLYKFGIPRLLDLGLIITDYNSLNNQYAYHWTYLGQLVIKRRFPN